jgi:hypothetical protein
MELVALTDGIPCFVGGAVALGTSKYTIPA